MTTPPILLHLDLEDSPLIPINGHGPQLAARTLRLMYENRIDFRAVHRDTFFRLVKNLKGRVFEEKRGAVSILFEDVTALVGVFQGQSLCLHPQPFLNSGVKGVEVFLRDLTPEQHAHLVKIVTQSPGLASNVALSWAPLNLQDKSWQDKARDAIAGAFLVLGIPQVTQRRRSFKSAQNLDSITYSVLGRKFNPDASATDLSVKLDPLVEKQHPEWSAKTKRVLKRIASHPTICPNPLDQVCQAITCLNNTTLIEPQVIMSDTVPQAPSMSAHDRFSQAACIPDNVF